MTQRQHNIPFNKPFIVGKELYHIARAVIENRHLAGDGPYTRACEQWLEAALGARRALLTHSGTAALEMAALLLNVQPGDEVIMPSFTFVSTANAFVLRGAVPVFVDIRPDTLNMDETLLTGAITPRTKGMAPVHYAGEACAMDAILRTARINGLWVVEDAAHALLATYDGRYLGTLGDLGCLSFHETKNIICGEGGALLINSETLAERAEIIREKGTDRKKFARGEIDKYTWVDIGSSFLPGDMVAAFLYAQLEQAHAIIQARCKLLARYDELLTPLETEGLIRLPRRSENSVCNGHLYYILTRSPDERSRLIRFLKDRGIMAVFHYVPLHSSPAGLRYGRCAGDLTVTEDLSGRLLRLPLFFEMSDDDVRAVATSVTEFYLGGTAGRR